MSDTTEIDFQEEIDICLDDIENKDAEFGEVIDEDDVKI